MDDILKIDKYFSFYGEAYTIERNEFGLYWLKSDIFTYNSNTMEWLIKGIVHELKLY